jgi:hypothetical protein
VDRFAGLSAASSRGVADSVIPHPLGRERQNSTILERISRKTYTWVDNQPKTGESYYYVRVIQANDQMAWSSPIWIRR